AGVGGPGLRPRRALRRRLPGSRARARSARGVDRSLPRRWPGQRGECAHAAGGCGPPPVPDRPGTGLSLRCDGWTALRPGPVATLAVNACPVLGLVTATPFVAACLIMLVGRTRPRGVRLIAVGAAGLTLGLSLYLYLAYDTAAGGFQFREQYPLVRALGISVELGVDGISALMVLLTAIIIFAGAF